MRFSAKVAREMPDRMDMNHENDEKKDLLHIGLFAAVLVFFVTIISI